MKENYYIAIDLKSFYASVECVERKLDPLTTNLVVADASRTEKTIGLAVSPSLKSFGIPGRPRLFEVIAKVNEINNIRRHNAPNHKLVGESFNINELNSNPSLAVGYITAPPRMAKYMEVSTKVYDVYLKYIAPEDIHVYSVDEVFIDVTHYLRTYKCTPHELALRMIRDVLATTGITATAGIGTNLYLSKVAMDILAKKIPADKDGVRIAELDEMSYREKLWSHKPLTDFWRVGNGYTRKLESKGMFTMGDIARRSIYDEETLYKMFGVNAELLIDHAWGFEPCEITDIKAYKPQNNSLSSGQVLSCPYKADKAKLIVHEMIDLLVLDLVEKHLVTNQIVLTIGYDIENLTDSYIANSYKGEITTDHYGRQIPKHSHGTENLKEYTSSTKLITEATLILFDRIINSNLSVRRITVTACNVIKEETAQILKSKSPAEQLDFFTDYDEKIKEEKKEKAYLARERARQEAIIELRQQYGKNAILKGMNFEEGGTTRERNSQIGGHRA